MKFQITINSIQTVEQIENYWTDQDYIQLLEKFDYPDADKADKETLKELLLMAITDYEPSEAAAILLEYKLADRLSDDQIQQISHDMLLDKISEEYPEIDLHPPLFHINQLLFKAYNGTFPSAKASIIECSIEPKSASDIEVTKEVVPGFSRMGYRTVMSSKDCLKIRWTGRLLSLKQETSFGS